MQKKEENEKNLEAYSPVKTFVITKVSGLPFCVTPPGSLFQYSHHQPKGKRLFFKKTFSSVPFQIVLCAFVICLLLFSVVELWVQGWKVS